MHGQSSPGAVEIASSLQPSTFHYPTSHLLPYASKIRMPDSTLFQTTQLTRVQWCRILLRLAAARAGSARDAVRVFYHLALKPSLAFRGWARFDPSRILSLSVRGPGHPHFAVHARDNGSDVGTFEEF